MIFQVKCILATDAGNISLSTDQGKSFTSVWSQTDLYNDSWMDVRVPLADYAGQNVLLRIEYLPGNQAYTQGGGLWIDTIRLENVTGSEYSHHPIYYAPAPDLSPGEHYLAYQVWTGDLAHDRSDGFTITMNP